MQFIMAEVNERMQLDFEEAMTDFKIMFPDMECQVIEAVLRSNQGAVHATIDQLLTITSDTIQEQESTTGGAQASGSHLEALLGGRGASNNELPPSYALSATPPPSYQQAVPTQSPVKCCETHVSDTPLKYSHGWSPPQLLPLPQDFLKLPSYDMDMISPHHLTQRLNDNQQARMAVGESDVDLVQYLRDERIALFLQNDEFISELRTNKDFMEALQNEMDESDEEDAKPNVYEESQPRDDELQSSQLQTMTLGHIDDATLRTRLASMGKVSRKKFAQLARVFSKTKRGSASRGDGHTNGKDHLIDTLDDEDNTSRHSENSEEINSSPRHAV